MASGLPGVAGAAAVAGAIAGATAGLLLSRERRRFRLDRLGEFAGGPKLVAHRGGAGLVPENTLLAFRSAVEDWASDMIELDLRATSDGHCVVLHDPTVDRTTDGTGEVAAMTLREVRRLDAGYRFTPDGGRSFPFRGRGVRVPTIDEVFEALPSTPLILEVKARGAQPPLFEAIRRHGAEARVALASEAGADWSIASDYAGLVCASATALRRFYKLHRLRLARLWAPDVAVASVPEHWGERRIVTPRFIRDLHTHAIPVHVWTVDDTDDMHRLLDWGVDGLITDRPDRLADVLSDRTGRRSPPARTGLPVE
ncbi:MAG: glycerophosphodiester phosphodiesterase [Gemmatimonadota bacterium]